MKLPVVQVSCVFDSQRLLYVVFWSILCSGEAIPCGTATLIQLHLPQTRTQTQIVDRNCAVFYSFAARTFLLLLAPLSNCLLIRACTVSLCKYLTLASSLDIGQFALKQASSSSTSIACAFGLEIYLDSGPHFLRKSITLKSRLFMEMSNYIMDSLYIYLLVSMQHANLDVISISIIVGLI